MEGCKTVDQSQSIASEMTDIDNFTPHNGLQLSIHDLSTKPLCTRVLIGQCRANPMALSTSKQSLMAPASLGRIPASFDILDTMAEVVLAVARVTERAALASSIGLVWMGASLNKKKVKVGTHPYKKADTRHRLILWLANAARTTCCVGHSTITSI
ncbi:hypothetical protein Cgig2_010514 [Carnegiea gigantea]|uniref:Uncharacterized protein n=1 Tax=Carnegiea gigantea TaxID=171969 RepID=A0A9Q1KSI3_9CARY|nr:hypothetical protein Cgig2_010514 [Carnegiea gigantea]